MIGTVLLLGFTLGLNNFRTARLDRAPLVGAVRLWG